MPNVTPKRLILTDFTSSAYLKDVSLLKTKNNAVVTAQQADRVSMLYSLLGGLLNGGESGGRSTGSLRVAGGQARW